MGLDVPSAGGTVSLRHRLILLLSLFGLYAVVAAATAIFGSQLRIERAAEDFQRIAGQTTCVERLELLLTEQSLLLRQLAEGRTDARKPYAAARETWTVALQQCASFASFAQQPDEWAGFQSASELFEIRSNECLELLESGRRTEAASVLHTIGVELIPELRARLVAVKAALADARNDSARGLASTTSQSLALTVAVAVFAATLVIFGGFLVHRWLIRPISELHATTRQFREGHLTFRSKLKGRDELGDLGAALNEMADALAASEKKHHTLFANLRDAVVICDRQTNVVEYHDGDTRILAVDEHQHVGRSLLDVWPEWRTVANWTELIRGAIDEGRRARIHEVRVGSAVTGGNGSMADFVIYRVDCGQQQCAAIVVRDATQRHNLQERLHHAETMEALGTMAGGLAHDVNNLLASVMGTLSSLSDELSDPKYSERITRALRAVRRAGGLSKRLLDFAQGLRGTPQVFSPSDVVDAILDSLDPSASNKVILERRLDRSVRLHMDQDQFAQIGLNLVRNALDATPDGGRIAVQVHEALSSHPDRQDGVEPFAVLAVCDTGVGMPSDVENRMFEPFFTTKAQAGNRGRGMGLAIVYAAVRNAGGFIHVETKPNAGTTVRVYLPAVAHRDDAFAGSRTGASTD